MLHARVLQKDSILVINQMMLMSKSKIKDLTTKSTFLHKVY